MDFFKGPGNLQVNVNNIMIYLKHVGEKGH